MRGDILRVLKRKLSQGQRQAAQLATVLTNALKQAERRTFRPGITQVMKLLSLSNFFFPITSEQVPEILVEAKRQGSRDDTE